MKTRLGAAIDRICSGTITRESDALERLGALTDDARLVVDALSEAQARIEALEWLAQAQVLWLGSISWESTWCDACVSDAGHKECRDIYLCARAAAGV